MIIRLYKKYMIEFFCVAYLLLGTYFGISYNKNLAKEQMTEFKKQEYHLTDQVKYDVEEWVKMARNTKWSKEKEHRLNSLKKKVMMRNFSMTTIKGKTPIAYTVFGLDSVGVLVPTKIVFSDIILFEELGCKFVVYHELGHAIGLLADENKHFHNQIMWYQSSASFSIFRNSHFLKRKMKEQMLKPQNDSLISIHTKGLDGRKKELIMYLMRDGSHNYKYTIK